MEDEQLLQPEALPRQVGSFEILEEIGRGGMGIVFRARDLKLEREVALKRPTTDLLARSGFRQRFFNEARSASKLMHPNIVTVFEVFEANGVPWMAMEYIDGASLRSMLSGNRPLPVHETLIYVEGLTDALRTAHLANVLHRDVNPNNILIGRDGRARLTDFGLAEALGEIGAEEPYSERTTESRTPDRIAGTRGYMSPEQALGNTLDARSDIFSLGVVMYEMCTGEPAFAQHDSGNWLDALLHREPPNMAEFNPDIPPEVQAIVRKSIAKRPFQRFQSATEMLQDVSAARRRYDSDSGPISRKDERTGLDANSKKVIIGAVALSAAALVVMILALAFRSDAPAVEWKPRQVTSSPGWEGQPALSPDGTMIAYVSDESGNSDIWLVDVNGGESLQLTDDPAADHSPTWYPNNSAVAFVSARSGVESVWKVPRFGGPPVLVVEGVSSPAISNSGDRLAFSVVTDSGRKRIGVLDLARPDKPLIITGEHQGFWDHENPAWSPDDEMLVFSDFRDLWLVRSDGTEEPRRLTVDHSRAQTPQWSADGRWIYYSSLREGTTALWKIGAQGGDPQRLTLGTGPELEPSLSGAGDRLVYSTVVSDWNLVVVDRLTGETSLIGGDRVEEAPAVAPDGESLIFVSNRSGNYDLWWQDLKGAVLESPPRRITEYAGTVATPRFSSDGRWIAFYRVIDNQRDVWVLPAAGGSPTQITEDPAFDIHPTFSPDGKQLAFVSDRDGDQTIWTVPVKNGVKVGPPQRLLPGGTIGALFPAWSPDGEQIAFTANGEVWTVGVNSNTGERQVTSGADAQIVRWSSGDDTLLALGTWGGPHVEIRSVSLEDGASRPLDPPMICGRPPERGIFDVDSTGRIFTFLRTEKSGNIWFVELDPGN